MPHLRTNTVLLKALLYFGAVAQAVRRLLPSPALFSSVLGVRHDAVDNEPAAAPASAHAHSTAVRNTVRECDARAPDLGGRDRDGRVYCRGARRDGQGYRDRRGRAAPRHEDAGLADVGWGDPHLPEGAVQRLPLARPRCPGMFACTSSVAGGADLWRRQDAIILSIKPPDPAHSPLTELRRAIPVRLTTHPYECHTAAKVSDL